MARIGTYDESLLPLAWYDDSISNVGWITDDWLISTYLIKVSWAEFQVPGATPSSAIWKAWNGSAWVTGTLKKWNGSSWVTVTATRWNGSAWV